MLCAELVGRDDEVATLRSRVAGAIAGRGGIVLLVGEAGAGKSRLLGELVAGAEAAGARVLSGRCVPGASPVAYRPLTEALLTAHRGTPFPDDPSLAGFAPHLARLVPAWEAEATADGSPMLLGEAIVRLLRLPPADGAAAGGVVLALEDLHWADPETWDVVEYLADSLDDEPILCVGTTRPGGMAGERLDRLRRLAPSAVVPVDALGETEVDRMVGLCLGVATPPAGLSGFVRTHSDGNPFLVEELLAGLVASGALRREGELWATGELTPTVPASLRASIQQRLAALDPTTRRVVGAAALLGRQFDWELLPGIAEVDARTAADALRAAVDAQLIEVDDPGFTFRHALTREAVLADVLPPERHDLAARAWPAHERANPGLPGPSLELAADLAEAAGARDVAALHLTESARRSLRGGALATAEATARRAARLASGDPVIRLEAEEVLVDALEAAGKPEDALTLGHDLVARLATIEGGPARAVEVLLTTLQAALVSGLDDIAQADLDAARAFLGEAPSPALQARLDVAAAGVALARADLTEARTLAERAVEGAAATGQPAVEGEALIVVGHVVRSTEGIDESVTWYERAAEVAANAGLVRLHLQAEQERSLLAWTSGDPGPMHRVRALAARHGALFSVAVVDLTLAGIALSQFDTQACLATATSCVTASERYGLATLPVAHLWLAGGHALAGDHASRDVAIAAALAPDPDDPRILADLYGRVLATSAFVDDDLARLPGLMTTMIEHVHRAPPTTSVYPGRLLWALLAAIDADDGGVAERAELAEVCARMRLRMFDQVRDVVEAVAIGRAGDAEAATARATASMDSLVSHPFNAGLGNSYALLVARAAVRDGWGDPVRWLRRAEAFFASIGQDALVRRSRVMLGEAGAPVPRRGRGDSEVPQELRALGVTSREVDVLKLVVEGRTNKQIAEALVLSPKTVERHLSSLFTRLGVQSRQDLADRARGPLRDDVP